jgi:hypothetical protein
MISLETALELALAKVMAIYSPAEIGDDILIQQDKTVETEVGWVFYYNSRSFIETGDFQKMLMGNAPILVTREHGKVHLIRGDIPAEDAIRLILNSGCHYSDL